VVCRGIHLLSAIMVLLLLSMPMPYVVSTHHH